MPLTLCPDCGKKISTRSEHCIYCGCPSVFYHDGKPCQPDVEHTKVGTTDINLNPAIPRFLTIRAAAKEAGIPEHALRGMVARNEITFFRSGNKAYINLSKLQEHLSGQDT